MTEKEIINNVRKLTFIEKYNVYIKYYCNNIFFKHTQDHSFRALVYKSFEEFCSDKNIRFNEVGEDWKERGFASQKWMVIDPQSIFYYIYHNIQ